MTNSEPLNPYDSPSLSSVDVESQGAPAVLHPYASASARATFVVVMMAIGIILDVVSM